MQFQKVQVIINPSSGQGHPLLRTLNDVFRPAGIDWDVSITRQAGDGRHLAQQAVQAGADLVVACGGDGTVTEVASGLIDGNVPMAIIPSGTVNAMATELGLPADIPQACALLASEASRLRPVDMGKVDERYFMLRISTGFEAERVKGATRELKNRFGSLAYVFSALRQGPQVARYRLMLDGEQVESHALTCVIANSINIGVAGLSLFPDIDVSDGLLDVILVRSIDLGRLAALFETITDQEKDQDTRLVQRWQVREVTISTDPPHAVQADGEAWDNTPLAVRVLPQAVRVLVPTDNSTE
jgi:YegS/Rv2252/BmrU family lipid kinase